MPNWKAPGPDFVQCFWLKNFKSIQNELRGNLQKCLQNGNMLMWMTKGRITLMQNTRKRASQQVIISLLLACLWFGNY